jgi:hypothetical protein
MNHFRTPEFLGRTGDAIREFLRLVAQQGERTENPMYAATYQHLGDLYLRRKSAASGSRTSDRAAALPPRPGRQSSVVSRLASGFRLAAPVDNNTAPHHPAGGGAGLKTEDRRPRYDSASLTFCFTPSTSVPGSVICSFCAWARGSVAYSLGTCPCGWKSRM